MVPAAALVLSTRSSRGEAAEVEWFEIEPCYVYHPLNAHDDGDEVVLDVDVGDRTMRIRGTGIADVDTWEDYARLIGATS